MEGTAKGQIRFELDGCVTARCSIHLLSAKYGVLVLTGARLACTQLVSVRIRYSPPKKMYLTSTMYKKNYIEFFVNPTIKEIGFAAKYPMNGYIRFTADFVKQEVIVWNAIMLHIDSHKIIGNIKNTLTGHAEKVAGIWTMIEISSVKNKAKDFLWINKYIKVIKENPIRFV